MLPRLLTSMRRTEPSNVDLSENTEENEIESRNSIVSRDRENLESRECVFVILGKDLR